MSICVANVFIFIVLRAQISYSVSEHLFCVVFVEIEEKPWVLTVQDHLCNSLMRVVWYTLIT